MHRSVAVFLLALSCVCAAPVFIRFEDSDSKGKLLECKTPYNGLSFRCRFTSKSPEALGLKPHELPIFEVVEEFYDYDDDHTALEVEEISIPVFPPSFGSLFQSSKVVVNGVNSAHNKYEVDYESRITPANSQKDCAHDEVFNSEINMCQPHIPGDKPKVATIMVDDKPMQINPDHKVTKVTKMEKPRCKENEFYMSELDVCVPLDDED